MLRAILFDMGGTLDGDGRHWLDRFAGEYRAAGLTPPRDTLRAAFDHAERRAATDAGIASAGLTPMIVQHVTWQFEHLGVTDRSLRDRLVRGFESPMRQAAHRNRGVLAELQARGYTLGVVSNGCGNVDALCADLGYTSFLSLVIDSRRAGVAKPDLRIYALAVERLGVSPSLVMMVGDSVERDIVPAREAGMQTAWLRGHRPSPERPTHRADIVLTSLDELPAAIDARTRTVA